MSQTSLTPKGVAVLLGAVLCLLAAGAQAQPAAPRQRILIDRSGSMEGFFATGRMNEVRRLLVELSGGAGDSAYYFINKELVPASQEPTNFGGDTYLRYALDRALAQEPSPAILWIITDNQPSAGNQTESDREIGEFYDRLRSDAVKRLYFFPLKLDFRGKLYRDDGHALLTPNYQGKRGLLVYALLLDEGARAEFERVTSEFQSRYRPEAAGELRRVLIKPLEQDTITARLMPGDKFRVEEERRLVGGEFDEGAPIKGDFKVELTSQFGQMKISHADIDVRVPDKFRAGDFTESEISPEFSPHNIQDLEPQNQRTINVAINAPGVHIRNNLVSWWNCITHNRGEVTGEVRILVKARGEDMDVVSALSREYSTTRDIYSDASEGVQSRIYKLDDLVKRMLPERELDIRPRVGGGDDGVIPVRLVVRYPKRPVLYLLAAILALLLLLYLLYRLVGRPQLYRLTWDDGRYRACPDFHLWPFVGRRIELNKRTAATIKKSVGGIRVRAASGYTVDDVSTRLVSPGGTDFNVSQSADGAGVNFYFSTATASLRGPAARHADDGILGGLSYGGDGAGPSAPAAGAPPVRSPGTGGGNGVGSPRAGAADDSGGINLDDLFP